MDNEFVESIKRINSIMHTFFKSDKNEYLNETYGIMTTRQLMDFIISDKQCPCEFINTVNCAFNVSREDIPHIECKEHTPTHNCKSVASRIYMALKRSIMHLINQMESKHKTVMAVQDLDLSRYDRAITTLFVKLIFLCHAFSEDADLESKKIWVDDGFPSGCLVAMTDEEVKQQPRVSSSFTTAPDSEDHTAFVEEYPDDNENDECEVCDGNDGLDEEEDEL